ncbi:DEAD/DEAH box helicase family protein [Pseudomonas farris]
MSIPVLRTDPAKLSTTLKEAVVDSLLNLTYAQVSGQGPTGQYLFGARPRTLLNSGFLLPQKTPSGDDEVTSPIWISSHGLQMQLSATQSAVVTIRPKLSVYVRLIPKESDLQRPNCRPSFMLRTHVVQELREERNKRLDAEWEKVKGTYASRFKHPEWITIRERIVDEVYTARGIPRQLLTSIDVEEPSAIPDVDDTDTELSNEAVVATPTIALAIKDADFEPLAVPHKWMRIEIDLPDFVLDLSKSSGNLSEDTSDHATQMNEVIAERLKAWAESKDPETGGVFWGYRTKLEVPASQYKKWSDFLELARNSASAIALPKIRLDWDFQVTTDWLDPTKRNFFMALENRSESPRQLYDETEEAIFLVSIQAELPEKLHQPLKLERIEPSYRYNQYLSYPAMGHNGGVNVVDAPAGIKRFETTWTPRYTQPRIVPTNAADVERGFRALSHENSLDGLLPMVPAMQNWLDELLLSVKTAKGLDPNDIEGISREQQAFSLDFEKWRHEKDAIQSGLAVLEESRKAWRGRGAQTDTKAVVYEAWLGMNEAMADFMRVRFGSDTSEWRLFQLAFIITNIPAQASRIPEFEHHYQALRDDSVTLLYFATGGGKSEAFFGLLVFSLMLDRLRGKHTGITALIRYPLRLLTIQQAQRCARVLAQAELVKQKHCYGGSPLSIGFWVGSGGSPNNHRAKGLNSIPDVAIAPPHLKDEKNLCDSDQKYSAALRAWNKLPKCPFCGETTALRRFLDHGNQTLGHVCTDIKCPWNSGHWKPLPFYIIDEDIYDIAPSVLLGTVDKLALIGHSPRTIRRIYGMFGVAPWRNASNGRLYIPNGKELKEGAAANGMEELFPAFKTGRKLFVDPFPSLIIQDEAHLLDESLGTFAGLFESTLDAVFAFLSKSMGDVNATDPTGKRRRAKVIAASATVSEPERQLEHLYQRAIPATQFPYPGPTLYESFYAEPEKAADNEPHRRQLEDIELSSRQARVYCAFMTNGKPHTATSVAVLSGFHLTITRVFDALASGDMTCTNSMKDFLAAHVQNGPLHSLHVDAILAADASALATIVDLHRIALTYVTNKKGGDQIMAAEAEETRKRHLNAGIELSGLDTRLITGSVEQGEIQSVVDTAQRRVLPGMEFPPLRESLRSVIATSAISHGVDVDEFNSMFFAGMPPDIAEYIQASSRVGRTHIGFVVLVPTPQRRRDRHIIHIFDIFHRFLERMVQPAAIDRWAEKAIERVFPSLFQAYLTGVVPSRRLIELDDDKKDQTPDFSYIPNVRAELRKRGDAFINEINSFIELAVGIRDGFAPEGEEYYRQKIDERTRQLLVNTWATSLWGSGPMSGYFDAQTDPMRKPMTSLRDVDQGGKIIMSWRDTEGRKQASADVLRVMDVVRHGVADNEGAGD